MPESLFGHEIAKLIAAKVGIPAEYIDVYPSAGRWDASLRAASGIWTQKKASDVKVTARGFQGFYVLKAVPAKIDADRSGSAAGSGTLHD